MADPFIYQQDRLTASNTFRMKADSLDSPTSVAGLPVQVSDDGVIVASGKSLFFGEGPTQARIASLFESIDDDNSGSLDADELRGFLKVTPY